MIKNPTFWKQIDWRNRLLLPFSWLWLFISRWLFSRVIPYNVSVPIICVGNVVMGGAGKTPTVLALVDILKKMGYIPHILSRGYGAYIRDVMKVDPSQHTYLQVGDEPLLLARVAPTWAGPNRILSAKTAIASGATVLLMDDGLQNATLQKDISFLVVDAIQQFGNNLIFPAGPLREPVDDCMKKSNGMIVIGDSDNPTIATMSCHLPTFKAHIEAKSHVHHKKVVAFCGMGYPQKFKKTLIEQGYHVVEFVEYADHHPYTIPDIFHLTRLCEAHKATLITTEKDWLRLPHAYRPMVEVLSIALKFDDEEAVGQFILSLIGSPPKTNRTKKVKEKDI